MSRPRTFKGNERLWWPRGAAALPPSRLRRIRQPTTTPRYGSNFSTTQNSSNNVVQLPETFFKLHDLRQMLTPNSSSPWPRRAAILQGELSRRHGILASSQRL